jgi:hypothetical protein
MAVQDAQRRQDIAQAAQAAGKQAAAAILRAQAVAKVDTTGETCAAFERVDAAVVEGRR